MAIASYPVTVLDCPDPGALARFYGSILDWEIKVDEDGSWADIRAPYDQLIAFQRVEDYRAPVWPTQEHPQQFHLDLDVEDLDAGEQAVVGLGATRHQHQPGTTFRVFLDPAGHPFCLCQA